MSGYFKAVANELKDWKKAIGVVIFTVARLIFGYEWLKAGLEKISWLSDKKPNSQGLITGMIASLQKADVAHVDPLHLNVLFTWVAQHIFNGMPYVTDFLVVVFEILVGVFMILGFRIFWTALLAIFMNIQYITAGSANNFGYIWTDLAFLKFSKYAEVIGLDGIIRFKRGKNLL